MNRFGKIKTVVILFLLILVSSPLLGLTIKLSSPFPQDSIWHSTLRRMAAEWYEISDKKVRIRIYPGGITGDEGDTIRKMRFSQLDAAVLTSLGMKLIVPNTFVMSLPGILRSEQELNLIIRDFSPQFNSDFIAEGFRLLAWSKSGWAYFFTRIPAKTPEDLRNLKLSVNNTDEEFAMNFKALGFNVVPVSLNEVIVALQSGMINAVYGPPIAVTAYQWFSKASHMLDFQLAPVLGGIVINERIWQRIPKQYHEDFQNTINRVALDFYRESERLNEKAMDIMKENGITVHHISETEADKWFEVFTHGHSLLVGDDKWIAEKTYKDFMTKLDEIRNQ